MLEIDVSALKADLVHCSMSASRYEEIVVGGKDAGQADIRYAKDLAKYYRDAAEKVRAVYLALLNDQLASKVVETIAPFPTAQEIEEVHHLVEAVAKKAVVKKQVEKVEEAEVEETFGDVFNELPEREQLV